MEKPRIAAKQPAVLSVGPGNLLLVSMWTLEGPSRSVTGPTKEPDSSRSSFQ